MFEDCAEEMMGYAMSCLDTGDVQIEFDNGVAILASETTHYFEMDMNNTIVFESDTITNSVGEMSRCDYATLVAEFDRVMAS